MRKGKGSQAMIGDILPSLLKKAGLEQRVRQGQIMLNWKEVVGPANARHSWPIRVNDGVLLVGCSSPAWAQTMMMLRRQIMDKIAKMHGDCPLRDIHFSGVRQPVGWERVEEDREPAPAQLKLPVEQQQWIHRLTEGISEPLLQNKAKAALGSLLRQRMWHELHGNRPCSYCGRMNRHKGGVCLSCQKEPKR